MEEQKLSIPIDNIKNDFQEFLNPQHNCRIIFSGPFGIGKTYFLNEFFKEKDEEFYTIFLRPVNYSLLSNEDVFKLIKYDILTQIIQDERFVIENEFDFTNSDYLKYFLSENRFLILRNLLKAIPKIRNVIPAAEELEKLFSKYQEGVEEINKNPDLELLKEFQQESESNFLLEYDEVSDFISSQLDEITISKKEGKERLKKVLVIDDLDRLDPEHIFRLFNVFSAHFDQVHYYENSEDNDNKFGFDKIIFVCDIENIRKIFAHKYGEQVDFSGYIDKFYSTEIYSFLHDYVFDESIFPFVHQKLLDINPTTKDSYFINDFKLILRILFYSNQLNIRDIIRFNFFKSIVKEKNKYQTVIVPISKFGAPENTKIHFYNFLLIIRLLIDLIGDKEVVREKLFKTQKLYNSFTMSFNPNDNFYLIFELILFADIQNHKFENILFHEPSGRKEEKPEIRTYDFPSSEFRINYYIDGGYFNYMRKVGEIWVRANPEDILPQIKINHFIELLLNAVDNSLEII